MDRFEGRSAIVTGGAAGIGAAIVRRLRKEGAEVMVWDMAPSDGITLDITDPDAVEAAVKAAIFDQMTQSHIDFMLSKIPMGRFGKTGEIASLVAWLASEECSFTTGGVFDISGGRATY